jgi:hypothetical protein
MLIALLCNLSARAELHIYVIAHCLWAWSSCDQLPTKARMCIGSLRRRQSSGRSACTALLEASILARAHSTPSSAAACVRGESMLCGEVRCRLLVRRTHRSYAARPAPRSARVREVEAGGARREACALVRRQRRLVPACSTSCGAARRAATQWKPPLPLAAPVATAAATGMRGARGPAAVAQRVATRENCGSGGAAPPTPHRTGVRGCSERYGNTRGLCTLAPAPGSH